MNRTGRRIEVMVLGVEPGKRFQLDRAVLEAPARQNLRDQFAAFHLAESARQVIVSAAGDQRFEGEAFAIEPVGRP